MNTKRPYKGKSIWDTLEDYTVIDLETTGRNINTCEIIELAALKVRGGLITDEFTCLVQPNEEVPDEITKLTGITNEMLVYAPYIDEVIEDFLDFIGDDIILGHNISSFDSNIIYDLCEELNLPSFGNDILDTYHYARRCDIDVPDYRLTTLTDHFSIEHDDAHRALADCKANFECYETLKPLYKGCSSNKSQTGMTHKNRYRFSEETKSLQMLSGIIEGIICDGTLSDGEIFYLKKWTDENKNLTGNFPFDVISETITAILVDGIITEEERAMLLSILFDYSDPVENCSESAADEMCIEGSQIVLTGDFKNGERSVITKKLEDLGAIVKNAVSGKTNYLIIGSKGSDNWSCGNYGSKVKKALELQAKGKDIKIIKEEDFFK